MIIKTKFEQGEVAYIIHEDKIIKRSVDRISYRYKTIYYQFTVTKGSTMMDKDKETEREESECFKSIKELADAYK